MRAPCRPPWTVDEDALVREQRAKGLRYADIAVLLSGRTTGACSERAQTLGIAVTKAPDWTAEQDQRLQEYLEDHRSYAQIAARLKRTEGAVRDRAALLGACITRANGYSVNKTAKLLGVEYHTVAWWIGKQWLRSHKTTIQYHRGRLRIIEHEDLTAFLEKPQHWHLWEPARITDQGLRAWTTELRQGVRFLTTAQAGERLGLTHYAVNQLIRRGKIKAVKRSPNWLIREVDCVYPEWAPRKRGPNATVEEEQYIRARWGQEPATRIAVSLGRSDSFVCLVARRLGLPALGQGYWKKVTA